MEAGQRPFRTIVSSAVEALLGTYNEVAEQLRLPLASAFNVPELAEAARAASAE